MNSSKEVKYGLHSKQKKVEMSPQILNLAQGHEYRIQHTPYAHPTYTSSHIYQGEVKEAEGLFPNKNSPWS